MNKTEDWLALLLYGAELLLNPSPAKILGGYESWDYRRRLKRHLRRLEQRQLIQSSPLASGRKLRLTDRGRLVALGGRDPFDCWRRQWDGKWRIVMFDLPTRRQSARVRLIRWLRQRHFGYLQHSVWVHPHPVAQLRQVLKEWADDAETVMVMEANCAPGYSNAAIVVGAWDFTKINKGYQEYLIVADKESPLKRKVNSSEAALARWLRKERAAWLDAVSRDPLLPEGLSPQGYLGQQAAAARQAVLARVGEFLGR
jgi:phenylacetic acid degradation operon negative regulatory protein